MRLRSSVRLFALANSEHNPDEEEKRKKKSGPGRAVRRFLFARAPSIDKRVGLLTTQVMDVDAALSELLPLLLSSENAARESAERRLQVCAANFVRQLEGLSASTS